jgi:peptidylprolyl isomerase
MIRLFSIILASMFAMTFLAGTSAQAAGDKLVIELKTGKVVIQLRPDLAPKHVERVKTLASQGFYNGLKWHRVIDGFMAQTGDPTGTGMGGSKLPDLPAEFSQEPYKRGTVGAARTQDPNSANSQFFICFTDNGCAGLTGQYTVWGQVISGMENVDKIKRGEPGSGMVTDPDTMLKVYVE